MESISEQADKSKNPEEQFLDLSITHALDSSPERSEPATSTSTIILSAADPMPSIPTSDATEGGQLIPVSQTGVAVSV